MKHIFFAALLLPTVAVANEEFRQIYDPLLEQCYRDADDTDGRTLCIGVMSDACIEQEDGGGSTLGMSRCQSAEAEFWDVLLNDEYRQTMAWAKAADAEESVYFPEFANRAKALRQAQRAWIAFRDTECGLEYALWGSGSMRQIAGAGCIMQMTATRAIQLRDKREFVQ